MSIINYPIRIDTASRSAQKIWLKQGSVDGVLLDFLVLNNGIPVDFNGCSGILFATKPSGSVIANYVMLQSDGHAKVIVSGQMAVESGALSACYMQIIRQGEVYNTIDLDITVIPCKSYDPILTSASEFTILEETLGALANVAHLTGDETFTGYKSVSAPTAAAHVANKAYVDADWTPVSETWAYASATTITVPTGATSRYQKFDKIKYTQSSTVKYGRVLSVSDTVLTLIPSGVYAVANSAISAISTSRKATPFGFPAVSKWKQAFATASNVFSQPSCNFSINDNNTIDMNMFFSATGNLIAHGQSLFTLPENYRPSEQIVVPGFYQLYQQSGRSPCDIQINTNGVVYVFFNSGETSGNNIFGNATIIL